MRIFLFSFILLFCYTCNIDSMTLDFKDTDIKVAIQSICQSMDKGFIIDSNISGRVSVYIADSVKPETALRLVLKGAGLTYRIDDGVYIIIPKVYHQEVSLPNIEFSITETSKPSLVEKIHVNYIAPRDVINFVYGQTNNFNNVNSNTNYGSRTSDTNRYSSRESQSQSQSQR